MNDIKAITGEITGIHYQKLDFNDAFADFVAGFTRLPGTVVLMSGGDIDCARYHILAARPWLSFAAYGRQTTITSGAKGIRFEADPFDTLRMLIKAYRIDDPKLPFPAGAGLFGYLSYDLKDHLETLPRTSINDLNLPDICLFAPSIIVIHDRVEQNRCLLIPMRSFSGGKIPDHDIKAFNKILNTGRDSRESFTLNPQGFTSNFTMHDYTLAVDRIREYIASGDIYQANLSQRFETDFSGDPFNLFERLFHNNPAPFFAYINAGNHHIVSTSPERFLKQEGNNIETRPIKGTRPRGKTESEDISLKLELEKSKKDEAELSMIVDLLRNDLGKVCKAGSVRVAEHKRLEAYRNVYHLVSIVKGTLADNRDSIDLLRAAFPGGSITGCPKIRAMEIIDQLEPNRRHVYTGSIGYLSFHDTMDLSIAIRTATIYNGKMRFSVGGGIVYDSDSMDEYNETLHKGKTLMETLGDKRKTYRTKQTAWINGMLRPVDQAVINITDLGFQYGYGFFETIRVDHGKPGYLDSHMARFNKTWKTLFQPDVPDLSWAEIIDQVINENGLKQEIAVAKIIATWGTRTEPPFDHGIIVTARPYVHRFAHKKQQGLNLATYPHSRYTPLADHKTLNYLYYYLAGRWAVEQGANEALILNPDGSISETNSANILLVREKEVIRPASPHVLAGIMENQVCNLLRDRGYNVKDKTVRLEDLFTSDNVLITNSLIGALPGIGVDGRKIGHSAEFCRNINNIVL
jgi:para-aminobenzoate synthetase component 1